MAARTLRSVMAPPYPLHLHASVNALEQLGASSHLSLWDRSELLQLPTSLAAMLRQRFGSAAGVEHYLHNTTTSEAPRFVWKLAAILRSNFERTLFLDTDLYVLWPSFVHTLLSLTLPMGDVAMPIDVGRYFAPWSRSPVPPLCSAVMAYWSRRANVVGLLEGAAYRLIWHLHKSVRQGDQQMMQIEYMRNRTDLRVLTLPEEFYCPQNQQLLRRATKGGSSLDSGTHAASTASASPPPPRPVWETSWGKLWCKALHGHTFRAEQLEALVAVARHGPW